MTSRPSKAMTPEERSMYIDDLAWAVEEMDARLDSWGRVIGDDDKPMTPAALHIAHRIASEDSDGWVLMGICQWCIHQVGEPNALACAAFPDGIPDIISRGDFDHRFPYPGDHGMTYAQRPDCDPTPEDFATALPGPTRHGNPEVG